MLKDAAADFGRDDCPRLAAALSYYTIFSLPPLLILLIMIAGALWDTQDVQRALEGQLGSLLGPAGSEQVQTMIDHADRPDTGGVVPAVLGIGALIFGATGVFVQLQAALNRAWQVAPDPDEGGLRAFIAKRLLSLGMLMGIAFLLLVSLALSAVLGAIGENIAEIIPGVGQPLLYVVNATISLGVITLLFAALFKIVPDAKIAWRDVWIGALFTALLFVAGKFVLGYWLGRSDPGSAYGAAGSLALLLVWIYYAAMIVLFGAQFTQAYAERRGSGVLPDEGAVRVRTLSQRELIERSATDVGAEIRDPTPSGGLHGSESGSKS